MFEWQEVLDRYNNNYVRYGLTGPFNTASDLLAYLWKECEDLEMISDLLDVPYSVLYAMFRNWGLI